jgi:hypothetical protein
VVAVGATGYTSGDPRKLNKSGYAKGDVVAADAAGDLTPIPVGADTEVLTADSTDAEGVDWQAGGGGGGGGTPSNTVVAETSYGQASTAGAAPAYSRGDHTHGTPSLTGTAPATALGIGQAAALGAATAPARADHVHPLAAAGAPVASAVGDSQATGAATTFAASDHRHAREAFGAPVASAVGDTQSSGVAATVARSDHRHAREAFGSVTAQTSFGAASSDGAAATVARSDHTHGTPAAPTVPSAATTVVAETAYGASTAVGVAAAYAREDHTHGSPSLTSATPAAEAIGASGVVGVAVTPARADHVHAMPAAGTPGSSAVGDSAAQGAAATLARSDHTHGREAFGAVTAQTAYGAAGGNGAAATVARSDHTHGTPSLGTTGTTAAAGNDTRIVNAVQQTLFDAKGDLIAASAADTPARLVVGSDGQVLRADSGQATGLAWDTLTAADVGADAAGSAAAAEAASNAYTDSEIAAIDFPVDSVNGETGTVTLDAGDVGAAPTIHTHAAADITSGTLGVARGGTGIASFTTNNYIRASAATTLEQRTPAQVVGDIGAVPHTVADAKGDLLAASAADTFTRLSIGTNGHVLTADSAETTGMKWAAAGGGGGSTLVVRKAFVTSGDVSLNLGSGAWNLISGFSLAIPAAAGDYVELAVSLMSASGNAFLDLAVVVSAAAVRYASTDTGTPAVEGLPALYKDPNTYRTAFSPWAFEVASGDISGGNVTFGVAMKGTTGTLFASTNYPFIWYAKNYGAVDYA